MKKAQAELRFGQGLGERAIFAHLEHGKGEPVPADRGVRIGDDGLDEQSFGRAGSGAGVAPGCP